MLWSCCCHTGRGLSPLSSLLFQSILKNSCPYPSRWFTLDSRFVAVMNVYCISKFQPRSSSEDLKILGVLLTCLFKCFHIVIMILHRPYLDRTASYTTWTAKEAELSGPVGHSDIVMNKNRTSYSGPLSQFIRYLCCQILDTCCLNIDSDGVSMKTSDLFNIFVSHHLFILMRRYLNIICTCFLELSIIIQKQNWPSYI